MNKYSIYCTEEQTKKAFELGAPITQHPFHESVIRGNEHLFENIANINGKYYCLPTAEQMIGWLEEQRIMFNIATNPFDEYKVIMSEAGGYNKITNIKWNKSRKEATLAAIDAALEYLIYKKQRV